MELRGVSERRHFKAPPSPPRRCMTGCFWAPLDWFSSPPLPFNKDTHTHKALSEPSEEPVGGRNTWFAFVLLMCTKFRTAMSELPLSRAMVSWGVFDNLWLKYSYKHVSHRPVKKTDSMGQMDGMRCGRGFWLQQRFLCDKQVSFQHRSSLLLLWKVERQTASTPYCVLQVQRLWKHSLYRK